MNPRLVVGEAVGKLEESLQLGDQGAIEGRLIRRKEAARPENPIRGNCFEYDYDQDFLDTALISLSSSL